MTIGGNSQCNYTDFCCDFDAYKIGTLILEASKSGSTDEYNIHLFSDILKRYYVNEKMFRDRFKWLEEELDVPFIYVPYEIELAVSRDTSDGRLLIEILAGSPTPSDEVVKACCDAFCAYMAVMRTR